MHAFPTSPNPKINFDAKKSGKLDGNTLSPMDILCNMTLLGNVQSLFSMVWPLLNFSRLGKATYRLGVHCKKHMWRYISVKGLQKERRSKILYLVSYTSGKLVKALWSHKCLLEFLWDVCYDLCKEHMCWWKSAMGRGLYCVLGSLEVLSSSQYKAVVHKQGIPISPPGWLLGLCRQHWFVPFFSYPGKTNCMRFLKDFLFFSFQRNFFLKLFCYLKLKIWLILPALVIFTAILVVLGASQYPELSVSYPPHKSSELV